MHCRSSTRSSIPALYYPPDCFNVVHLSHFPYISFSQILCPSLPSFISPCFFSRSLSLLILFFSLFCKRVFCFYSTSTSYHTVLLTVRCSFLFVFGSVWFLCISLLLELRYTLTPVSFDYIISIKWIQAYFEGIFFCWSLFLFRRLPILLPLLRFLLHLLCLHHRRLRHHHRCFFLLVLLLIFLFFGV